MIQTYDRRLFGTLVCLTFLLCAVAPGSAGAGDRRPLFTFVQVTDTHLVAGKTAKKVKRAVDDINLLEPQPEFAVMTGDLINGEKPMESTRLYDKIFSGLRCPRFEVFGNHDDREAFQQVLGPTNYSFDVAPYHFIVLDSIDKEASETYGSRFCERTISWLKKHLREVEQDTPIIVFSHASVYRPNSYSDKVPGDVLNYQPVLDLLEPYDVVAWFAGHAHGNYTVRKNGVKYVTTACVSDLRENGNAPLGYRVVRVWKDHVESTYRTIDRFGRILRVDQNADVDFTGEGNMMRVGPGPDRRLAWSAVPLEHAHR